MQIFNIFRARGTTRQTPKHPRNDHSLSELNVDRIDTAEDARYDAMTEAERDTYYVNPNLKTRIRKFFRGS
jgi:hypothetical protein